LNPDNGLGGIVPLSANSFPSPKSAKLAHEFAILARQDGRAAKFLYKHKLYGLSVFHSQQGVEKATKAVGLLMGLIEPTASHLLTVVSHNSLNAITLRLAEYVESIINQWDKTMKIAKESPDFEKGVTMMDTFMALIFSAYVKEAKDPEEAAKREDEVKKIPTWRERFERTQAGVEKARDVQALKEQLAALHSLMKSRRGYVWKSTMGLEPNPGMDTVIASLRTQAKQAEEALKAMKRMNTSQVANLLSDPEFIFYFSYIQGIAFQMAMNIAVLTMWHEEAPRYPPIRDSDYWTFDAYTKDARLVKLLPELIKWTAVYCEAALEGSKAVLAHYSRQISIT
jgi:HEPN domain-containing protein